MYGIILHKRRNVLLATTSAPRYTRVCLYDMSAHWLWSREGLLLCVVGGKPTWLCQVRRINLIRLLIIDIIQSSFPVHSRWARALIKIKKTDSERSISFMSMYYWDLSWLYLAYTHIILLACMIFCLLSFSSRSSCIVGEHGDEWVHRLTGHVARVLTGFGDQCTQMTTCRAMLWAYYVFVMFWDTFGSVLYFRIILYVYIYTYKCGGV